MPLDRITVQTPIPAPLAAVWAAYTTPRDIMQWNFASPDWHCPAASVDLREAGAFSWRMEARDGSFGFDFAGDYTRTVPMERIDYTFGDRAATVRFAPIVASVQVTMDFDAETENAPERQREGWQAILDNFARHVAGKTGAETDPPLICCLRSKTNCHPARPFRLRRPDPRRYKHLILTAGPVDSNVSCPDVVRLNHCPEGRRIRYDDSYHTNRP